MEEQLSFHTQASDALQTKVEKLEERDTALESWIKDSDISKRLDKLESEKQQTQAKIQQLEYREKMFSHNGGQKSNRETF